MKLISMTDFVLEQYEQCISSTGRTYNYAMFLKQPLELWMFIPCDEDGNVLVNDNITEYDREMYFEEEQKYQQEKERCLFEGNFTTMKIKDYYIIYLDESAIYLSWN